jgi:predicted acyl esterase
MSGEGANWRQKLSQPSYEAGEWQKDVPITARDGTQLYADVCLPKGKGPFPALISMSAYGKDVQHLPIPVGLASDYSRGTGGIESGLSAYFVTRGYAHVILDPRGIGKSGGEYDMQGPKEQQDGYDGIEWIAAQPWSDGNVGMLGMSYFACIQYLVAAQQPPHLKAIFAHDGFTDFYRHNYYQGGLCLWGKAHHIWRLYTTTTVRSLSERQMPREAFEKRLLELRNDPAIQSYPYLWKLTLNAHNNPMLLDLLVQEFDGPFYRERSASSMFDRIKIPVFLLSRWSAWAIHLPGAIEAFEKLPGPRRLVITETPAEGGFGRPWHENHDLVLRWYDYWLKGIANGVMDEPPVKIFVRGTNKWRAERDWPLARTRWTKLYLRAGGRLSDTPAEPHEPADSFINEPWPKPNTASPCVAYASAPMQADTEYTGPAAFYLYADIEGGPDAHWIAVINDIAPDGRKTQVTKGWLKASHRELDGGRSRPERPYHPHSRKLPVKAGEIYEYAIELRDTSNVFRKGHRIELLIRGQSSPWEDFAIFFHLNHMDRVRHRIHHTSQHPSYLLMPLIETAERENEVCEVG